MKRFFYMCLLKIKKIAWGKVGAFIGVIAAITAILTYLGFTKPSDFSWPLFSHEMTGNFVTFRDTDFQISLLNRDSIQHLVSSAKLVIKDDKDSKNLNMTHCCRMDTNAIKAKSESILYLRSTEQNSNFGFYKNILYEFKGKEVVGQITLIIKTNNGSVYELILDIPSSQITPWKNEKIEKLEKFCKQSSPPKPYWCDGL